MGLGLGFGVRVRVRVRVRVKWRFKVRVKVRVGPARWVPMGHIRAIPRHRNRGGFQVGRIR